MNSFCDDEFLNYLSNGIAPLDPSNDARNRYADALKKSKLRTSVRLLLLRK